MIQLHEKYGGKMSHQFDKLKKFGIKFIILSLYVQDDYIDEVVGELESRPEIKPKDAAKVLRRFSNQVGALPRHSGDLNAGQRKEEHVLKLKREADIIKEKFEEFKQIKGDLKDSIASWNDAAKKYGELSALKEDLGVILLDLK